MDDRGGGAAGRPEDNVSNQDRPEDATVLFNQRFSLGVMEAPRAIAVKVPYYLCIYHRQNVPSPMIMNVHRHQHACPKLVSSHLPSDEKSWSLKSITFKPSAHAIRRSWTTNGGFR